jgi:hypothetical protein
MTDLYQCPDCGRRYRADKLNECPGCGVTSSEGAESSRSTDATGRLDPNVQTAFFIHEDDLDTLVDAQDRTTYAVRALALFFFTTTATSFIGLVIYYLNVRGSLECELDISCLESYSSWSDLGPAVAALGLIAGIVNGISELRASKPY